MIGFKAYSVPVLAILAYYFYSGPKNDLPKIVHGTFEPKFEEVARDFQKMLQKEAQGLTMAVLHKGQLVLNLYGGYADIVAGRNWSEDTMTVAYSCTKLIGTLAFATLVSRKQIHYNDKVTKYWPNFGKHGKESLTVDDIVNHKAGLIKFARDFTLEEAKDHKFISKLIEESKPVWNPGKRIGYHALTYGFLLDQLFQRVHPQKKTIGEFYEQEIRTKASNRDFYLGVPKELSHRLARITLAGPWQTVKNYFGYFSITWPLFYAFYKNGGMALDSGNNPYFMSVARTDIISYNNIDVLQLPSISSLGLGTAAGFAHVVREFWRGNFINEEMWKDLEKPSIHNEEDLVLGIPRYMKHGFFYRKLLGSDEFVIHFPGNGKQYIDMDHKRDLVVVILRNGLRGGLGDDLYDQIRAKVFQIIETNK